MKITKTPLNGLLIVDLDFHGDERGFFLERFHIEKFSQLGLPTIFNQINHSRSGMNILRGLHYQHNPGQGKLVGVIRGGIYDVAVDIRPESTTYGRYFGIELTDTNGKLLWVPEGFAHGFCVTSEELTDVIYNTTSIYNPAGEGGIAWDDPEIAIDWPIKKPILSEKDTRQKSFSEYKKNPPMWNK
jgi:dTDP-4-dehydrorhamnose 3,5-epimerase